MTFFKTFLGASLLLIGFAGLAVQDSASTPPTPASTRPARPEPSDPGASSALCTTRRNESGSGGAGGTRTYKRRPSQKTAVAMNISSPGMPKATAGPWAGTTRGNSAWNRAGLPKERTS